MNVLNDYGVVLSGQEIVEYAKRRGLCQLCGRTQTHRRSNNLFKKLRNQWQPLTIMDEDDNASFCQRYLVYKGYCLQPTCYTLDDAKRELGELAVDVSCDNASRRSVSSQISKSMQRFSSAKFSSSSGKSYEFSILEQKASNPSIHNRLSRPSQLYPTSSNLSDVSSLGASAISEETEDDTSFLREFNVQHIVSPTHPASRASSAASALAGIPTPAVMHLSGSAVDDGLDAISQSESTRSGGSSQDCVASIVPVDALNRETTMPNIDLPSDYNVNVSLNCSNILTIQRGSLQAMDLITNACGGIELQRQTLEDTQLEHEEGFEVAFADDMHSHEAFNSQCSRVCDTSKDVEKQSHATFDGNNRNCASTPPKERSSKFQKTSHVLPGVLTVFQSAPLTYLHPETRQKYTFPLLDFSYESTLLTQSLQDAERIGCSVRVETEVATVDRMSAFFAQGGRKVLHLSCHGHPEYLLLENGCGAAHPLPVKDLKRFVSKGDLDLAFVSACYSRSAGEAFLQAGVRHVVCCRHDSLNIRDEAAAEFACHFYRALACRKSLKEAFELAKASVGVSSLFPNAAEESDKFLLLPETPNKSYHDIQINFTDERSNLSTSKYPEESALCSDALHRPPERFIGRESDLFEVLNAIRCSDWVHIMGERGVGKTTLISAAEAYISKRLSSFMRDKIVWIKGPDDAKQSWNCLARAPKKNVRPLVIFDARVEANDWTLSKQLHFLQDILSRNSNIKLLTVGYDETFADQCRAGLNIPLRTVRVGRLNHHDSVCLFSSLATSKDFCPQELASILSMSESSSFRIFEFQDENEHDPTKRVVDALHNFRKKKVYDRIGEGLPKHIAHFATSMSNQELADCLRWANRQNVDENGMSVTLPSSRAELEELIRCTLAKEGRSLREEDYTLARHFRESLEEWQSLRSIFPTMEALRQELTDLYPKMQEAIRQRRYNVAEELRNRRTWLEKQLHREEDYLQVEERFQQARIRARDLSFHSASSVSSRSSYRSHVSGISRTSCRSRLSAASRSSYQSQVSAQSSQASLRSQKSSISRSSRPKHDAGRNVRGTPRMYV